MGSNNDISNFSQLSHNHHDEQDRDNDHMHGDMHGDSETLGKRKT